MNVFLLYWDLLDSDEYNPKDSVTMSRLLRERLYPVDEDQSTSDATVEYTHDAKDNIVINEL